MIILVQKNATKSTKKAKKIFFTLVFDPFWSKMGIFGQKIAFLTP